MSVWLYYLVQIVLFAGFAFSLNLLLGYAGQTSVGHAGFAAVGGYTVAYLVTAHGWAYLPALVAGTALAGLAGLLLGLPALRLSAEYLILLTMAFTLALTGVLATFPELGGARGLSDLTGLTLFGLPLDDQLDWLALAVVASGGVYLLCRRLGESPYGRVLRGIREDAQAMRAHGKNVFAAKLAVFGLTSAAAGLVGGVYTGWLSLASPGLYGLDLSMTIIAMVILGGAGNLAGSLLGAVALTFIQPLLRNVVALDSSASVLVQSAVYGLLILLVMLIRPQGLLPERARPAHGRTARGRTARGRTARGRPARARASQPHPPRDAATAPVPPPSGGGAFVARPAHASPSAGSGTAAAEVVLRASGVSKRFGAIVAADGLDLELRRGRITALVGPNGAGKTTVFNLLTGFVRPDAGSVLVNGAELVGRRPEEIAGLGVVRTFQDVRLARRLTCLENVLLAVPGHPGESLAGALLPGRGVPEWESAARERAMRWLGFAGLEEHADTPAAALSYGEAKLVSLARALATEAGVLLLDEPASGIDGPWVERMLGLIEEVRAEGRTVCIVEHNLHVVERLADDAYFMELGKITARGTVAELTASPRLAEAYFGVS